jgi:hypothetical protein
MLSAAHPPRQPFRSPARIRMRTSILLPALATLLLAAPAAAQPAAPALLRAALEQTAANAGPEVRDYAFTVVHGGVRTPVYVYRDGTDWNVRMPETPLADLVGMAVFWPDIASAAADPAELDALAHAEYARQETLGGRRTHVVSAVLGADAELEEVDSALVYVDAETRQVVRVMMAAPLPAEMGQEAFGPGGTMLITVDAEDFRAAEGLTVPGQVRVRMRLQLPNMTPEARTTLLSELGSAREALREETEPGALEMLAVLDTYLGMLSDEGLDVRVAIEDVRVNPGRPDWLDEPGF